jgi:methylaspartate mutase epsilon subunit
VKHSSTATEGELPSVANIVEFVRSLGKPTVPEVLARARELGRLAIQPRCGVGGHEEMLRLLRRLDDQAQPDVLTVTIDSHTRLNRLAQASQVLRDSPQNLNGYPLVAHGWRRGRELNAAVRAPLEVRHGSPEPYSLLDVSLAAGFTSFEGGGISYNVPYAKDVSITNSMNAYRWVDARCAELTAAGLIIDRELFGTLTAVLVPPSISLAVSVIEAVAAVREGVRCLSIAYPQGGNVVQDVAALRSIRVLAGRYLPVDVTVHPVLHEFMGVFPSGRVRADALIFYGALVARLGGASKLITKTNREAYGIPTAEANAEGMRLARVADSALLSFVRIDEDRVAEEAAWIQQEVDELVAPVLEAADVQRGAAAAFERGLLDVPFSASRHARSAVIPRRDPGGSIRYLEPGGLPFSGKVRQRQRALLAQCAAADDIDGSVRGLTSDINYFAGPDLREAFDAVASPLASLGGPLTERRARA